MILAAEHSAAFNILLFFHVITAVVAFAPAFMTFYIVRLAQKDPSAATALELAIQRMAIPAIVVVGLLGFGLVGASNKAITMSESWISGAIVCWLGLISVTLLTTRPAAKALAAGDANARKKLSMGTGLTHALFLVIIALMVFQPGA